MTNKKLTLEELRKFIVSRAKIVLKEEEITNDEDFGDNNETFNDVADDNQNNIIGDETKSEFSDVSTKVNQLSKKIDVSVLVDLDEVIEKAKTTGRIPSGFDYNKMAESRKNDEFNYYTTVLASLYNDSNTSEYEKTNIKRALLAALYQPLQFTTYGSGEGGSRPSLISRIVANKVGISNFGSMATKKTIDYSYYQDIISDSLERAIDYILNSYNPERGGEFPTIVIFNTVARTKSELQSKRAKTSLSTGNKSIKGQSLDEPLGNSEEEESSTKADRFTGEEGQKSTSQKEASKELKDVINFFIESRLKKNIEDGAIPEDCLTVYKMLATGSNLSEIADFLKRTDGSVRQLKARLQDVITFYVQNGSFQKYIKNKTGIKVSFPNNEFNIAVQGVTEKGEEKETLEYFEETGIDPKTGEIKGQMVPLNIAKEEDDENGTYDWNIGDVGIKGDAETRGGKSNEENPDDLGPDDQGLNESFIADKLMKLINKRILKEFGND